jgi:hypothetical protein
MGESTHFGLQLISRTIVNGLHPSMFVRYYFKSQQQNQTLVIKPHINETNIKIAKKSSKHLTSLSSKFQKNHAPLKVDFKTIKL